jgi:hypothetical protein
MRIFTKRVKGQPFLTQNRVRTLRNGAIGLVIAGIGLTAAVSQNHFGWSESAAASVPGFGQPRAFAALMGAGDEGVAENAHRYADKLRRISEKAMQERMAGRDGGDGSKDDFQSHGHHSLTPELRQAIEEVGLDEPFGAGVHSQRGLPRPVKAAAPVSAPAALFGDGGLSRPSPGVMGMPIAALGTSLAGPVLGVDPVNEETGTIEPEGEEGENDEPRNPPVIITVDVPSAEVPLPAGVFLFPAGLAALFMRRRG